MRTSPRAIAFMNEIERVMQAVVRQWRPVPIVVGGSLADSCVFRFAWQGVNDQDAMQLLLTGHGQKFVFPPSLEYKRASEFGLKWAGKNDTDRRLLTCNFDALDFDAVLDWYEFPNGETIFDLNAPAVSGANFRSQFIIWRRPCVRNEVFVRESHMPTCDHCFGSRKILGSTRCGTLTSMVMDASRIKKIDVSQNHKTPCNCC